MSKLLKETMYLIYMKFLLDESCLYRVQLIFFYFLLVHFGFEKV